MVKIKPFDFTIFVLIYGLFNWITYRRVLTADVLSSRGRVVLGLWATLMVLGPLFVPTMDWVAWKPFGYYYAYGVYTWLIFVFIQFFWPLLLGAGKGLINLLYRAFRGQDLLQFSPRNESRFYLALGLVFLGYGFFEAAHPMVEKVEIISPKIPKGSKLRIALVADLHLGFLGFRSQLDKTLALAREAQPDLVISVGDLFEFHPDDTELFTQLFRTIEPPLGKFGILGNHEAFAGTDLAVKLTRDSGFILLRNEKQEVTPFLTIAGFDDVIFRNHTDADIVDLLHTIASGPYVILLQHTPQVATGSKDLFDLQLSGHTHHGQIFPYYFILRAHYGFPSGLTRLAERSSLYVSRGLGTFGPPIRIFAPPELTIIDLVPPR